MNHTYLIVFMTNIDGVDVMNDTIEQSPEVRKSGVSGVIGLANKMESHDSSPPGIEMDPLVVLGIDIKTHHPQMLIGTTASQNAASSLSCIIFPSIGHCRIYHRDMAKKSQPVNESYDRFPSSLSNLMVKERLKREDCAVAWCTRGYEVQRKGKQPAKRESDWSRRAAQVPLQICILIHHQLRAFSNYDANLCPPLTSPGLIVSLSFPAPRM